MMALSKLLHMALVDSGVVVGTKRMLVPEVKLLTGSMNPVESVGATRMRCSIGPVLSELIRRQYFFLTTTRFQPVYQPL